MFLFPYFHSRIPTFLFPYFHSLILMFLFHGNRDSNSVISDLHCLQASSSWDGTVRVWDLSQNGAAITLRGHDDAVFDVTCSPVELGLVASCGRKGMVALWDARNQGQLVSPTMSASLSNRTTPTNPNHTHQLCYRRYREAAERLTVSVSLQMALNWPLATMSVRCSSGTWSRSRFS